MSQIHNSAIHERSRDLHSVKAIHEFQQYSIQSQSRRCTDVLCIIVGVVFSALMFIVCFAIYNKDHYFQANFPTDSDGRLCGIQYPGYTYVYFTSPNDMSERLCVQKCPTQNDQKLICKATKSRGCNFNDQEQFRVQKYQTDQFIDRNGHFCLPKDEKARQQILLNSKLRIRNIYFYSQDIYVTCSIISAVLALIYLCLVQFFPKQINKYIIYIGAVMLLVLLICVITYPKYYLSTKILVSIVFLLVFIVVVLTAWMFKEAVIANGVFLKQATSFVKDFPFVLINIFLFLGIAALFMYIMILELNSIWTHSDLVFEKEKSLYWEYKDGQANFFMILWTLQLIWGLFFIKQSFNFIVSSFSVLWYHEYIGAPAQKKINRSSIYLFPYKIYITKHIGSVIGCAFMSAFFNIFDTIFDLIRVKRWTQQNTILSHIVHFLDLVRSEALAYITLTGNSYCNSARYCQYLCDQSYALEGSQSASRAYRLSAYSTISGVACILGLYIHGQISLFGLLSLFIFSYFIVNFFVQLHADSADAILVVYLQTEQFACRHYLENDSKNKSYFGRESLLNMRELSRHTRQIIEQLHSDELYEDQRHLKKLKQMEQSRDQQNHTAAR